MRKTMMFFMPCNVVVVASSLTVNYFNFITQREGRGIYIALESTECFYTIKDIHYNHVFFSHLKLKVF